jgi:prephenate dehydrogenase
LPHVAAFALAASLADDAEVIRAALPPGANATSLRDSTRIAASGPAVWRDIFLANADRLLPHVSELEARVTELRSAIETRDAAALERLLRAGQSARRALFPT